MPWGSRALSRSVLAAALVACGGGEPTPAATADPAPQEEERAPDPAPGVEAPAPDPDAAPWIGGLPSYPGARELCYQHVTGEGVHVMWTGWASPDPIERVRAFYERHRGAAILDGEPDRFSLRLPDAPNGSVGVSRVDAPHPDCGTAPEPADQTYFVVSQQTGG